MADTAKANSHQPARRKKTATREKKRSAHTPSARRKQSKSSQIDLFDEEDIKTAKKEETKKIFPKRIAGAKSASEELAAAKRISPEREKVVSQPKTPTISEPPREALKQALPEVVEEPAPQNQSRVSPPSAEPGPRRLLRSQQQRAAKLRMISYIGGGVLILLMIAVSVFLLVRGRTRTNIKGVIESPIAETSASETAPGDGAAPSQSGEDSDVEIAIVEPSAPEVSIEEQQPERVGEPTGVSDSQEPLKESGFDMANVEAESTPPPTNNVAPEILPEEQAVSPSEVEGPDKAQATAEPSATAIAPGEAEMPPAIDEVADSTPASTELPMTEKATSSIPVASSEPILEETAGREAVPAESESSENISEVDFSSPWTNSLGMKFVPVDNVLFSVWETRVKDFEAFCEATGRGRDRAPYEESEQHPVSRVNWKDTQEFCAWLTQKERSAGIIGSDQHYRLPTDREWSLAVGLEGEVGDSPEARDGQNSKLYPWGTQWPPPNGAGNIADRSASSQLKSTVDSYTDGYVRSAPVGSFEANSLGIFDLSGNLWEWCQDAYGGKGSLRNWRVMRGGGWSTYRRNQLLCSYRSVVKPSSTGLLNGFRCVLARE